ncbi:MAG: DUF362 domain-containing protein [Phycisphaerae bacterium]|nr:DUF362 domain-containing protein [Phycisphaerae bacterium]
MTRKHASQRAVARREFMRMGVAGAGAMLLGETLALGAEPKAGGKTDVWVLHGTNKKDLMNACLKVIAENGGFGKDVKKLTLKINAAWWRTPKQAANTSPELADAFLKGCKGQGIKQIVMPEHPVDPAKKTFGQSGLLAVAKANGVPMIDLASDEKLFKEVQIPKGKRMQKALVGKHFLETDALVNMPVAKHHGGATLTMAMKNWMGAVKDRRYLHRNDLHQCIADLSTLIKPNWAIIDAMRIMLDRGPKGPSRNMKELNLLVVSKDQIAADAYTSTLFPGMGPDKVKYLTIAGQMKLGTVDLSKIAVHKIEVG